MRKRSNINFNMAGKVSLLGISLVACATAFPMMSAATYAEGSGVSTYSGGDSLVGIAFNKVEGSNEAGEVGAGVASNNITPLNEENLVKVNVGLAVTTTNTERYDIYLGSSSSDLTLTGGCNGNNCRIAGLSSDGVSSSNIKKNEWGYSFNAAKDMPSDTYKKVKSTSTRAEKIGAQSNPNNSDPDYYTLSFAANVGSDLQSGTYENQVTLSVVSTAKEVSRLPQLDTISNGIYMQQVSTKACSNATTGTQYKLKDARDGKTYYIAKLADNNCWMTQNLDFDIPAGGLTKDTLEPETDDAAKSWKLSDLTEAWTTGPSDGPNSGAIPATVHTTVESGSFSDNQGSQSWDPGDYKSETTAYTTTASAQCKGTSFTDTDIANCKLNNVNLYSADTARSHYHLGNYYQWCAATAGCKKGTNSGSSLSKTDDDADSSICPAGWTLPKSGSNTDSGSFSYLNTKLNENGGSTSSPARFMDPAYNAYFVYDGYVDNGSFYSGGAGAGNRVIAYYWSSTVGGTTSSYTLHFNSSSVGLAGNSGRRSGFSVRCLLKTS